MQHVPVLRRQRLAVLDQRRDGLLPRGRVEARQDRWVFDKPPTTIRLPPSDLRQHRVVARPLSFRQQLLDDRSKFIADLNSDPLESSFVSLQFGAGEQRPRFQNSECHQPLSIQRIPTDASHHGQVPLLGIKSILATGHIHAGDQPLQIPLPRPDGRLVEVVDVDHDIPLRSAI